MWKAMDAEGSGFITAYEFSMLMKVSLTLTLTLTLTLIPALTAPLLSTPCSHQDNPNPQHSTFTLTLTSSRRRASAAVPPSTSEPTRSSPRAPRAPASRGRPRCRLP